MTAKETLELYEKTGNIIIKDSYPVTGSYNFYCTLEKDPDTGETFWVRTDIDYWQEI